MRGEERRQRLMLMIMESGDRVPKEHPLRRVKELADAALAQLSPLFDEMYSALGRPSIPPERLLKASLLMALHTVRSDGCSASSSIITCCSAGSSIWMWPSRASTTRPSRATGRGCWSTTWRASFSPAWWRRPAVCSCSRTNTSPWTATLVEAWASLKSFKPRHQGPTQPPDDPGNPTVNFHGERRSNATHQSTSDPKRSWRRRERAKKRSCVTRPTP